MKSLRWRKILKSMGYKKWRNGNSIIYYKKDNMKIAYAWRKLGDKMDYRNNSSMMKSINRVR